MDVEATAAEPAAAAYDNAGQDRTAPTRLLVHHSRYEAFVAGFSDRAGRLRTGPRASRRPTTDRSTAQPNSVPCRHC